MPATQPAPIARLPARVALAMAVATMLLGACSHAPHASSGRTWYRPWHKAAPAGPEVAHELVAAGTEAPLPQYWDRSTLQVDLTAHAGEGSLVLRRAPGHDWPIRLALLARPGSVGHVEVRGDQRVVLAVPAGGDTAVLGVPPGLYSAGTPSLTLKYGP